MKVKYILALSTVLISLSHVTYAQPMRDPTRPPGVTASGEEENAGTMRLTAIMNSTGSNIAIINGQILKVGDTIDDYKVVAIQPQAAILEHDGEQLKLPIVQNNFKQPVS